MLENEDASKRVCEMLRLPQVQRARLFPGINAILLMGDSAIKGVNYVAKKNTDKKLIPGGPTYKIRKEKYFYARSRVFPSYLQTGKSYLIEATKRKMIAEDIKAALEWRRGR